MGKKIHVRFTAKALADIDQIAEYHLRRVGPQSAQRITDRLLSEIAMLEEQPYMGPIHSDPVLAKRQYRKLVCGDYICIYRVDADAVYLYRIVHGSTDYPPHWIV